MISTISWFYLRKNSTLGTVSENLRFWCPKTPFTCGGKATTEKKLSVSKNIRIRVDGAQDNRRKVQEETLQMRGRCDSRLQSVLMNKMSSPYSDYSPSPRKKCYGQIVCNSNFHNVLWQNFSLVILIFFFHAFVTNGIERDKIHRILLKLIYRKYSMKNTEYFNRES